MTAFLIRRIAISILTLFAVITITFFLVRLMPGNPFSSEKKLSKETKKALEGKFGLDKPLLKQYTSTMTNILRCDFGLSLKYQNWSVNEILLTSFPVSAFLGFFALTIAVFLGVTLGAIAAVRRNSLVDYVTMACVVIGICIPNFVIAPVLVMIFAFFLKIAPPAGWEGFGSLILPAITLALPYLAYISRLTRASMLESLNKDYIRTARAKGITEQKVTFEHALRNSIIPVVTFLGPAAAGILTGSFVVEYIFNIPGLGIHFVNAIQNRDYFLIMGLVTIDSALLIFFNLFVDISYPLIDPRVKLT